MNLPMILFGVGYFIMLSLLFTLWVRLSTVKYKTEALERKLRVAWSKKNQENMQWLTKFKTEYIQARCKHDFSNRDKGCLETIFCHKCDMLHPDWKAIKKNCHDMWGNYRGWADPDYCYYRENEKVKIGETTYGNVEVMRRRKNGIKENPTL